MPHTASSSFWTSGVPLRDLEITLPLPHSDELPLGLGLHAFSPGAFGPDAEPLQPAQQLLLISGLAPGSVAEKQLRPGDILRSINGEMVGGDVSVAERLIASAPGVLRLHVLRPMNAGPTPPALAAFDDTGFSGLASYVCAPDACGGVVPVVGGVSRSELELVAASYLLGHSRSSRRPSASMEGAEERLSGADQAAQWRRRDALKSPRGEGGPFIDACRASAIEPWAGAAEGESVRTSATPDAPLADEGLPAGMQDGVEEVVPLYFALLETFGG